MGRTGGQGSFEFHGDSQTEVGGQGGGGGGGGGGGLVRCRGRLCALYLCRARQWFALVEWLLSSLVSGAPIA